MTDRTVPTEPTWLLKQGATPEQALERIAQRIAVWRDADPDEDESWGSYYSAAFDMLSAEVDDIISAVSKPIAASPPAPAAEPVAFTYRNWRGEVSERHVRIIGIRFGSTEWHPEPQLLLRAFDLDKGEEREFAVNDIGPHPLDAAAIRAEARREAMQEVAKLADDLWGEGPSADYDNGGTRDGWDMASIKFAATVRALATKQPADIRSDPALGMARNAPNMAGDKVGVSTFATPDVSGAFETIRKAYLRGAAWICQYGDDPLLEKAAYDYADATLADKGEAEGWRSLDDCPSDGSPIWLASFEEGQWWVTEREADGEWWRSMSTRRMWMPRQPAPAPPAGGRDGE